MPLQNSRKNQINFTYTGAPAMVSLEAGFYLFECWGAKGIKSEHDISQNGCKFAGGGGGYARGIIKLHNKTDFFVYVGGKGSISQVFNGNNVSDSPSYRGGGATDIRLTGGDWYLFDSLKSRIIVAGGSGGAERYCGGEGGGLEGLSNPILHNSSLYATGGTQTSGGEAGSYSNYGTAQHGTFGNGGTGYCHGNTTKCDPGPGGGGGYYGGGGVPYYGAAGGGSSFISGLQGCNAIFENSTEDHIIHSDQSIHYSGYYFTHASIISGREYFESPTGEITQGNEGNGYARITFLSFEVICSKYSSRIDLLPSAFFVIAFS